MGGEFGSGQIPHHPPQKTPYRKLVFHNELARMICCNLTWMRLSPVLKGFPQLVPAGLHSEIFGTCFWRLFVSEMLAYPVIKWENDFSCTSSAAMCGEEACGQEWLSLMGKAPRGTPVVLGSQQAEGKCGLSIQEAWAGKRVWYLLQSRCVILSATQKQLGVMLSWPRHSFVGFLWGRRLDYVTTGPTCPQFSYALSLSSLHDRGRACFTNILKCRTNSLFPSTTAGMYLWKTCCTVWERLSEAATEDGSEAAGCNWQGCAFSKHHCRHELREAPIS